MMDSRVGRGPGKEPVWTTAMMQIPSDPASMPAYQTLALWASSWTQIVTPRIILAYGNPSNHNDERCIPRNRAAHVLAAKPTSELKIPHAGAVPFQQGEIWVTI
ncbi:hypothetical protein K438DRAFT_1783360 [Mycena galopus ATCC 62051]|nr:hypothetical protein K438DRAFT_1783360 [Mycena galopus ATCC 62051]